MEEYYKELSSKNRYDENKKGTRIFNVGEGDIEKFPELKEVYQIWILPSNNIQLIYKKAVRDLYEKINLFN